jgi:hypothetical protein
MSIAHAGSTLWTRLHTALAFHLGNLLALLRRASPWVLAVPVLATGLIVLCQHTPARGIIEKATEEIVGPCVLAVATLVSLVFWARAGDFHSRWLALLSAALFCRELHFFGTNNGIYLVMILLLWYASRHLDSMRPLLDSRAAVSLFCAAIWTYLISKTFDRAYWGFIPVWHDWQDSVEETLETTAHLLILSLVVTSYIRRGTSLRAGSAVSVPRSARVRRWGLAVLGAAGVTAACCHVVSEPPSEPAKPKRIPGGLPLELSALANVSAAIGPDLLLASSDESRRLTLWQFDEQGSPVALEDLELKVSLDDGDFLHLDDLEDIAWDGRDTYYAVSSHRHILPEEDAARFARSHGTECALVSFQLSGSDGGVAITHARPVTRDLLAKIRQLGVFQIDWTNSKAFRWRRLVKSWQLDIEGLACVDGKLLLGFRNPVEDGLATILSYDPAADQLTVAARPDLGGQGILSLHYDQPTDRLFVLSNNPLKDSFGDSRLWIATRAAGDSWHFPAKPTAILERAADGLKRKASGLAIYGDKLLVCFDSETRSAIRVFDRRVLTSKAK